MSKCKNAETAAPVSAELERLCADMPQTVERIGQKMEMRYYTRLAEEAQEDGSKELSPAGLALEAEVREELEGLRRTSRSLAASFQAAERLADELNARAKDMRKARNRKWYTLNPPANAAIDLEEARRNHFAQGLNIYKVLLICIVGSFAGVVVETLWCLMVNGYVESRAGLVYGPFNLLYGAGAVFLTAALYQYRNCGYQWSFLGGFVVGSVLEYVCSWAQETLLGSRSWDYSNMPLNLNGRICLLYSIFWGILGVLWIKDLYPRMAKYILKIPGKIGRPLTWALTIFLTINAAVSCVAVGRWAQRLETGPAASGFWYFIDERFPDERMERIFTNMEFGE